MKNIQLIKNKVLMISGILAFLSLLLFLFLSKFTYVSSILLGYIFGAFIFIQLVDSQVSVIQNQNKSLFFKSFLFRMILYVIPVVINLYYFRYFNFIVLLISLLLNQWVYVILMTFRSFKKIKSK